MNCNCNISMQNVEKTYFALLRLRSLLRVVLWSALSARVTCIHLLVKFGSG